MLALDNTWLDSLTRLEVGFDGEAVPNLAQYRLATPIYSTTWPPGNTGGFPTSAGQDNREAVAAEGYWLLFLPPPAGKHVLTYQVEFPDPGTGKSVKTQWTLNLLVLKPNEPLP
jgi:hypothetical protein